MSDEQAPLVGENKGVLVVSNLGQTESPHLLNTGSYVKVTLMIVAVFVAVMGISSIHQRPNFLEMDHRTSDNDPMCNVGMSTFKRATTCADVDYCVTYTATSMWTSYACGSTDMTAESFCEELIEYAGASCCNACTPNSEGDACNAHECNSTFAGPSPKFDLPVYDDYVPCEDAYAYTYGDDVCSVMAEAGQCENVAEGCEKTCGYC